MNASNIGTSRVGSHMILTPKGSLTHQNCQELEAAFQKYLKQGQTDIILDLKSVAFMDSATLEILVQINDALKTKGSALKVISANNVCKDILLVTRLANVFQIYPDLQGAIKNR
ncbi:MAG: STAS domain-containing protein [Desulfobacterales bacterium]|nr:STAS domain-containing protein [Desulfobacterales bacterium]